MTKGFITFTSIPEIAQQRYEMCQLRGHMKVCAGFSISIFTNCFYSITTEFYGHTIKNSGSATHHPVIPFLIEKVV